MKDKLTKLYEAHKFCETCGEDEEDLTRTHGMVSLKEDNEIKKLKWYCKKCFKRTRPHHKKNRS